MFQPMGVPDTPEKEPWPMYITWGIPIMLIMIILGGAWFVLGDQLMQIASSNLPGKGSMEQLKLGKIELGVPLAIMVVVSLIITAIIKSGKKDNNNDDEEKRGIVKTIFIFLIIWVVVFAGFWFSIGLEKVTELWRFVSADFWVKNPQAHTAVAMMATSISYLLYCILLPKIKSFREAKSMHYLIAGGFFLLYSINIVLSFMYFPENNYFMLIAIGMQMAFSTASQFTRSIPAPIYFAPGSFLDLTADMWMGAVLASTIMSVIDLRDYRTATVGERERVYTFEVIAWVGIVIIVPIVSVLTPLQNVFLDGRYWFHVGSVSVGLSAVYLIKDAAMYGFAARNIRQQGGQRAME